MKMLSVTSVVLVVIAIFTALGLRWPGSSATNTFVSRSAASSSTPESRTLGYSDVGLSTNTARHSIPLEQVLDGGPGKDGIPALTNPKFTTVAQADASETDGVQGILVTAHETTKFYPYNILVWHEVVNDTVGGKPLVVTFCPLCGSAIVYDATVEGKAEQFGVSGKLYNSNLLMYDKTTESLWSQIEGEAVVGDKMGAKLNLYPSQVVSFKTVREQYQNAHVLSTDTGYRRDYSFYPYGSYNTNGQLYFPVSITDTRLPAKEIMYIVNFNNHSVAFKVSDLKPGIAARVDVAGKSLTALLKDGTITTNPSLPGYHAMWFAWAVYHQKDGVVWTTNQQR